MRRVFATQSALIAASGRNYTKYADYSIEDPLLMFDRLEPEEQEIQKQVRKYCQEKLLPRVTKAFRNETKDREIFRELGELGVMGPTIKGYGCAGVSNVAAGLISREIEAVDSAYRSSWSVQSSPTVAPGPCSPPWSCTPSTPSVPMPSRRSSSPSSPPESSLDASA